MAGLERRSVDLENWTMDQGRLPLAELAHCIERLPAHFRDSIELRYRTEATILEAATAAEVGREAMKKRLQRARAMLAECLRAKGVPA